MKLIIKEIQRLSKFSLHEMNQWYKKLQPILEHNNKQLYSLDSLNELTDKFNDIKEDKYASHVREPLGKGYSR